MEAASDIPLWQAIVAEAAVSRPQELDPGAIRRRQEINVLRPIVISLRGFSAWMTWAPPVASLAGNPSSC